MLCTKRTNEQPRENCYKVVATWNGGIDTDIQNMAEHLRENVNDWALSTPGSDSIGSLREGDLLPYPVFFGLPWTKETNA
jgi:hypothetical protein